MGVDVEYKPYMIDPSTAPDGEEFDAYCRRRWGGSGWTRDLRDRGQRLGLGFSAWKIWPNTLLAHALGVYVEQESVARGEDPSFRTWKLVEILNDAIYERGEDVSTLIGVLNVAKRLDGIDIAAARKFLEGEDGVAVVRQRDRAYKEMGISGVPYFVIEGSSTEPVVLRGAQPTPAFVKALQIVGA